MLFDFYVLQRKTVKVRPQRQLDEEYGKLDKLMPSMRRKMQVKLDFERMLIYRPTDVMYSLQLAAHLRLRDRELRKNENILTAQLQKTAPPKTKPVKEIVARLYPETPAKNVAPPQQQMQKLHDFGRKLSEAQQNAVRDLPDKRGQSLQTLFQFWSDLYDK